MPSITNTEESLQGGAVKPLSLDKASPTPLELYVQTKCRCLRYGRFDSDATSFADMVFPTGAMRMDKSMDAASAYCVAYESETNHFLPQNAPSRAL